MAKGKSIRILIPDCNPKNVIEVTMPSWDGIAFRIKRDYLQTAKDIVALKQCGVYFLYGVEKTSDGMFLQKIYVGQGVLRQNGKGVFWRIKEHDISSEKYWTEAIAFVDSKKEWGKTEISYLENRFTDLILKAKKNQSYYEVVNGNTPNLGNVTKAKQWELDDYIEGAELILQILGYDFFTEERELTSESHISTVAKSSPNYKTPEQKQAKQMNSRDRHIKTNDNFPFKVGRVMSCAFREALATGRLNSQIKFLESEEASKLFKTRGNRVIVSGKKPSRDSGGRNRFAKNPVQFDGKTYWITTQIWKNGLSNLLSFLEQHGMSRKEIEKLCRQSEREMQQGIKNNKQTHLQIESFFDYLKKTMCKYSASNYASAFRVLNAMLIKNNIIEFPLSNTIADQKLEEIKKYVSSDKVFLTYNKQHHYSCSAVFKKYLEYLDVCNAPANM